MARRKQSAAPAEAGAGGSGRARGHERGEYRPVFVVMLDGPEFRRLSAERRWILLVAKLSLGPLGLASRPGFEAVLAERSGYPIGMAFECLSDLCAQGWLERDGSVVWLVRGLAFEPALDVGNENHRKYVQREVRKLPNVLLLQRFREVYAPWFADDPEALPMPSEGPSEAIPITYTYTDSSTAAAPDVAAAAPTGQQQQHLNGRSGTPVRTAWDGAELTDEAREHFEAFARAHPRPHAFRAEVRKLGPGGIAETATWAELSAALVQYAGSEFMGPPGLPLLQRFIAAARRAPTTDDTATESERALRAMRAQAGRAG